MRTVTFEILGNGSLTRIIGGIGAVGTAIIGGGGVETTAIGGGGDACEVSPDCAAPAAAIINATTIIPLDTLTKPSRRDLLQRAPDRVDRVLGPRTVGPSALGHVGAPAAALAAQRLDRPADELDRT